MVFSIPATFINGTHSVMRIKFYWWADDIVHNVRHRRSIEIVAVPIGAKPNEDEKSFCELHGRFINGQAGIAIFFD